MTPTERVQKGLSALSDSYRGVQPGGKSSNVMQKYMPTRGEIRNINEKYQRGADIQKYVDKNILYQRGLEEGATTFIGPDGIERLNLSGTGIKTPEGATVLSMFKPSLTATAPTFGQLVGDIGRGLGSLLKSGADFLTSGGITGALFRGVKDLFTDPTGTAKNMYYGAQDMMKGYNPLTKPTVAPAQEIKSEPLPGLDLGAKMSAYTDPIQHYNKIHQVGYVDEPKFVPRTGNTPGKYTDSFLDKMDENRDYYRMNEMPAELLMPKQELNRGVMTPEEFRLQKLIQPYERLEASNTLQDPYALLRGQNNQTMIFNRGGRVRGTGIMGAL